MKNIILITFIFLEINLYAQTEEFEVGSTYDFPTFKEKLSEILSKADSLDKFSIVIKGNIPSKRFERLLDKYSSEISVFDTNKLVETSTDTLLVNHVYYAVYFTDTKKTFVFLRSYSKDLVRITGEQTIFSMLGTTESHKSLNIYTIK
ncbi:MAG: hypothetical protein RIB01_15380 [Balneola sp.]